jgi:23S rRNA (cytidine1920-2'-O)/16S rRNA (cytidine1409-2'-O)-methyltransferase
VDASFISLKVLLPTIKKWVNTETNLLGLIKPQFEAGKKDVARGDGVIRDPEIHKSVLLDVLNFVQQEGFSIRGLIKSPLLGPKGNVEFLVWLKQAPVEERSVELDPMVANVLETSL